METLEFLMMAFALACTLGPALSIVILVCYEVLVWFSNQGFSVTIRVPPEDFSESKTKEQRYER